VVELEQLVGAVREGAPEMAFGSLQVGPVPFVQPGAPTSPLAFDQPPEYQAQLTPRALRRSPIVGAVCGASGAPVAACGW
jgi:hypothetical protein